jgi:O-antigen/teichoic acid export membrane protein
MKLTLPSFVKNTSGFKKYFKNTAWLISEKVIRIFSSLLVGVWVIRYLGPSDYGILAYAQSFVALFAVIATLGLDNVVIRELVKNKTTRDKLIGTAFCLKLMGAFGVLAILAVAVNFTSNDRFTNIIVFIIASGTIFQSFNVVDLYFQSKVMSKYVVYVNMITLLITSLVKIALVFIKAPLIAFAWVALFDSFIMAMGFLYIYIKYSKFKIQNLKFKRETATSLLRESWPLLLSGIVVTIYMKIDQIMIKEMMNAEAVGQYAAAVKLSEAWYFIPVAIVSSVFPAIINAKKISEEFYYARLQMLYDLMFWMAIAIALPMTFFSDWVVYLLYGSQYNQAGSVLMIHVWAGVFVFLGVASGKWLLVENLQRYTMINTTIGAIINIIINFILIPKIGVNGAAWATLISYFAAAYLFLFFPKKTRINFYALTKTIIISRFTKKFFNVKKNN